MRGKSNRMSRNGNVPATLVRRAGALGIGLLLSGCVATASTGPQAGVTPGYGYVCHAGVYMCRLPQQVPQGAQCSCPGLGAPSYGLVN